MGKKYVTQPIEVSLSWTEEDAPSGLVESCVIEYRKPNGTTGSWPAVYDEQNRTIYYVGGPGSSYGMNGKWIFWPVVTLTGGESYPGEPISETIYNKGE